MSFRADITIDWSSSPRLIEVAGPSVEVSMQDLYDTLRTLEAASSGMDEDPIVSGAGKEPLGGGVLVGLTITLLNATLGFEARPGPTWVICRAAGGNLVAVDDVGGELFPIHETAFVQVVMSSSSSATLQEQTMIQDLHAVGLHRRIRNPITGLVTIYEADGLTPRYTFDSTDDGDQILEIDPNFTPM
jgi:hypothetical protein